MKKWFKKELPEVVDKRAITSYAQEGEDLILKRAFEGKQNGFFIDVGAHDPKRFSNTYLLYLDGWRGINIDPLPGTKERFDLERPEDINLEMGVSEQEQELTYHMFNEPALNTFDKGEAAYKDGVHGGMFYITEKKQIQTVPLSKILNQYLPDGQEIDVLTIDVEGLDIQVLKSNDWDKYQPRFVLAEELSTTLEEIMRESDVYQFLKGKGYELKYRTINTSFYEKLRS